jgi:hypothetical protein
VLLAPRAAHLGFSREFMQAAKTRLRFPGRHCRLGRSHVTPRGLLAQREVPIHPRAPRAGGHLAAIARFHRHLDESQRAMIAAEIATMTQGGQAS